MLISAERDIFTETPRNKALPAIWVSLSTVNLKQKLTITPPSTRIDVYSLKGAKQKYTRLDGTDCVQTETR